MLFARVKLRRDENWAGDKEKYTFKCLEGLCTLYALCKKMSKIKKEGEIEWFNKDYGDGIISILDEFQVKLIDAQPFSNPDFWGRILRTYWLLIPLELVTSLFLIKKTEEKQFIPHLI